MAILLYISEFLIPVTILGIVVYGVLEGIKVYDEFICGARKGFYTVVKILPTLIGLMAAVNILRVSGFLDLLAKILGGITEYIGFPAQLMPLAIVRVFSTSAAAGLLLDLFKEYGTDSRIGTIASVIMCCTESAFYVMSVYYMSVQVKKTRYTLPGAIIVTLVGIVISVKLF